LRREGGEDRNGQFPADFNFASPPPACFLLARNIETVRRSVRNFVTPPLPLLRGCVAMGRLIWNNEKMAKRGVKGREQGA